jgi:hypothetical protein
MTGFQLTKSLRPVPLILEFGHLRDSESVLQIKTKIVSCHSADSQPITQEVKSKMIHPPLVFPATSNYPPQTWAILCNPSIKQVK